MAHLSNFCNAPSNPMFNFACMVTLSPPHGPTQFVPSQYNEAEFTSCVQKMRNMCNAVDENKLSFDGIINALNKCAGSTDADRFTGCMSQQFNKS